MAAVRVAPKDLRPGDELADGSGVYVTEVWHDADGTWIEYSDGDCGYQSASVRVFRHVQKA